MTTQDITITGAEFQMIREGVGLTRAEAASRYGVSVQSVQHWDKGKYAVPRAVAEAIGALEVQLLDEVGALVAHHLDAPDAALSIPRVAPEGSPSGWARRVGWLVSLQVPGLEVRYSDA